MTVIHGFELIAERDIAELRTKARLFRHQRTGAELLSLENDDENKSFGVNFQTPPPDSSGMTHIMEHSVLCGSRKYPLKEPFVELIKGSMNTFLNAFTFSDMTCYPVASTNTQDFYNLIDVYMDAVFYPRLTEKILQQEGWHYELDSLDAPLTYKGVVFNEMKGVYSAPDGMVGRYIEMELLPDTPYGHDSGGDPSAIPDLTYENFQTYHKTYYHPSNARFFFYGDDNPDERLRLVDAFIEEFGAQEVDGSLPLQKRFDEPRKVTRTFEANEEDGENKAMVTISWLLNEVTDTDMILGLEMLSYILVGNSAAPLRKTLIDSGLGTRLVGSGYSAYQRETYFSAGLKGIALDDADTVEQLILDTLQTLADDGIDEGTIEAALNTVEFQLRESNFGAFPRGIVLMVMALPQWMHGGDPLQALAYESALEGIKSKVANGERFFEGLIRDHLLSNNHRSTVIMKPDPTFMQQRNEAELQRLAEYRETLSEAELQAIMDDAEELRRIQNTPDSPEALATIPSLTLDDLEKENASVPMEVSEHAGSTILYHDLFTREIVYLDMGLNIHALPADYLPYIKLFGRSLLELGTETEDFVKLSQRIGRKTGGISISPFITSKMGDDESVAMLMVRGKSTVEQAPELFSILRDILMTVNLDNKDRFRQLVLEEKAGKEASLIPAGNQVVASRLGAHFSEAGWASEQMNGLNYLFFLRQLVKDVDENWAHVLAKLETIRRSLLNRTTMIFNVTVDSDSWASVQPQLQTFISDLPEAPPATVGWSKTVMPRNEGLTIPAQVNYVGKAANLYELGYELHGSHLAITRYLNTTWMWEKVRMQGGAYGGSGSFSQNSGIFVFSSYRDPNLDGTLQNYDLAGQFLQRLELSGNELTRSIIGGISQMDRYQLPDAKGYSAMMRYLTNYSDEKRQQIRDELLSTTVEDFHRFGKYVERISEEGHVVVLGSDEAINNSNGDDAWLDVTKVM